MYLTFERRYTTKGSRLPRLLLLVYEERTDEGESCASTTIDLDDVHNGAH